MDPTRRVTIKNLERIVALDKELKELRTCACFLLKYNIEGDLCLKLKGPISLSTNELSIELSLSVKNRLIDTINQAIKEVEKELESYSIVKLE